MQLHDCDGSEEQPQPGAGDSDDAGGAEDWPTEISGCGLIEGQYPLALLYCYLAALGPLLEAAAAAAAASSSGAGGSSSAAGVQSVAALQQLQQQLLRETWVRLSDAYDSANLTLAAGLDTHKGPEVMQREFLSVIPADAAQQMLQLATGVCTQLVSPDTADAVAPLCCANPGCTNCSKLSEQELVGGKSSVCSGCRMVRLCSAECNTAYWKAGHKQVCKRLRGSKQQQQAGGGGGMSSGSSRAGDTGGSSSRRKSRSRSSSTAGTSVGRGSSSSSSSSMRSTSTGGSQGSSARSSSSGVAQALDGVNAAAAAAAATAALEL
jgi:hypothetical protein